MSVIMVLKPLGCLGYLGLLFCLSLDCCRLGLCSIVWISCYSLGLLYI